MKTLVASSDGDASIVQRWVQESMFASRLLVRDTMKALIQKPICSINAARQFNR